MAEAYPLAWPDGRLIVSWDRRRTSQKDSAAEDAGDGSNPA